MPRVSREAAKELLADPIDQGQALLDQASLIGDLGDYEYWKAATKLWIERAAETLGHIYDGSEEADKFKTAASGVHGGARWQIEYQRDSKCLRAAIDILISLPSRPELAHEPADGSELAHERADGSELAHEPADGSELAPEPSVSTELAPAPSVSTELALAPSVDSQFAAEPSVGSEPAQEPSGDAEFVQPSADGSESSLPATTTAGPEPDQTSQVFLVHGRSETWKQAIAGLLERAGPHEVTILNERPDTRRMLVERFEGIRPGSRYAVVLLTADDVGAPRLDSDREPYFSPRARQDVVFAMGVLVAALTPRCVCVLYEDGVELPCDLDGIAYVRLDPAGTWRSKLLLQLRGAGFDYDLNMLPA